MDSPKNDTNPVTPAAPATPERQQKWQINMRVMTTIAIGVTLLVLLTLWKMHSSILSAWDNEIDSLEQIVSESNMLGTPNDIRVRISDLGSMARHFENRSAIKYILITKTFDNGEEAVVYPFYAHALEYAKTPAPYDRPTTAGVGRNWIERPLYYDGIPVGKLFINTDSTTLDFVRWLAVGVFTILLALLVTFLMQLRRQQAEISRTTIEINQKQHELMRMERMALAGQLSASLLHDLKKPVLNIRNDLDDFQSISENDRTVIREEIKSFLNILGDVGLEKFVAPETEAEYLDPSELIKRSAALVRYERRGCVLTIEEQPADAEPLPPIYGKRIRFVQVLSNIMVNAYQAMNGKGELRIAAKLSDDGKFVAISLSDTGPGISAENIENIFTPFHTTKTADKGTGLGLYIASSIITEAGGYIDVTGEPGRTCFTVYIPVAADTKESTHH